MKILKKTEIETVVEPVKEVMKIAKLAVDMGREDLNQIVMKINEVIEKINKVEN